MTGGRKTGAAAAGLAAVVLVVLAFLPRGSVDTGPPPPVVETEVGQRPDLAEPDGDREVTPVSVPAAEAAGEGYAAAPCEDCLDGRGAQDVAEAYLHYVVPNYIGVRLQLYADIPGDPTRQRLPKLPPGLVDAPADYTVSDNVLPRVEAPEETWVVWVQIGWVPYEHLEARIDGGILPAIARSWPPLKVEKYMLVDARTGAVNPVGIYDDVFEALNNRPRHEHHPAVVFREMAERAAKERTDHWLSVSRLQQDDPSGRTARRR